MCFSIILKDSKEEVEVVPTKLADMLGELFDIVSDNVPDGLSPMTKIGHQTNLVLGANLPNKVVPRMKLVKSEELNRQHHELLQKGWIRESLSPCVVPVVLAPKKNGE